MVSSSPSFRLRLRLQKLFVEPIQNQRDVLVLTGVVYEGPFDENGLRHGKGQTTLPSGVAHAGVYEKGRLDYSAKCTLTVPEGGAFPRPAQTNCRCLR